MLAEGGRRYRRSQRPRPRVAPPRARERPSTSRPSTPHFSADAGMKLSASMRRDLGLDAGLDDLTYGRRPKAPRAAARISPSSADGGSSSDEAPRALQLADLPEELLGRVFELMGLADLPAACCACKFWHESIGPRALRAAAARHSVPPVLASRGLACLLRDLDSALPSLPRIIVERWLGADDWRVRLGALRSFGRLRGGGSTGDSANIKAGYGEKFVAMRDHDPHPEVAEFARRVVERIERREDDD
jgi:hypothetical protein